MNPQSGDQERKEKNENQHSHPVEADAVNDISRAKPTGNNAEQPKDQTYWEKRQFRVQRLIAYAGVFGILIYGLQLWEMRKSTNAATYAAQVARDSLKFATENAHLEQRAWVGVMGVEGPLLPGKKYKVDVTLKNTGKTFANKVTIRAGIVRMPNWQIPDFEGMLKFAVIKAYRLGPARWNGPFGK